MAKSEVKNSKKAAKSAAVITPKAVVATVATTSQQGTKTMNDTVKKVEETVKKATAEAGAKATEMFKQLNVKATEAVEKTSEFAKEAVAFSKSNMEAVVESGKIASTGAQTAAQTAADFGRKNFEATSAMLKSAAAVKAPTELFELQGDFARAQFDSVVAEVSKASEYFLKLAGEVMQPISSRYAVASEEIKAKVGA